VLTLDLLSQLSQLSMLAHLPWLVATSAYRRLMFAEFVHRSVAISCASGSAGAMAKAFNVTCRCNGFNAQEKV